MTQNVRKILVIGATGTVGRAATDALIARGAQVRALVRPHSTLNGVAGVEVFRGDLRQMGIAQRALQGVNTALYVSPHEPDEEELGERFIAACEAAQVRLVFVAVHVDGATRFSRALKRFAFGRLLPHYRPKFRLAERARTSKANPVILMPTNFFQNDEMFEQELRAGQFVQPFEREINRVDVRDVGEVAARACLDPDLPSGAYPVVGPASLDGQACAAAWSKAMNKQVDFVKGSEQAFRPALERSLAGKKREDFLATYAAIRKFKMVTSPADVARTELLLGRPPIDYATYVQQTAAQWMESSESRFKATS